MKEITVNEFTESSAQKFREEVLNQSSKSAPGEPITINIDSYGGQSDSLVKMLETMDQVSNPFITISQGKALSCGFMLLAYGDYRVMGKHTRGMFHEGSVMLSGTISSVKTGAKVSEVLNTGIISVVLKKCGYTSGAAFLKKIKYESGTDFYVTPNAAKRLKLIDSIGFPKIERILTVKVNGKIIKKRKK